VSLPLGGHATLWLGALTAAALLACLGQWWAGTRSRARALPEVTFWIGATGWVALGLTAGVTRVAESRGGTLAMLLAIFGLVGTALLQWQRVERPRAVRFAREAGEERRPAGETESAVLDSEDRRLARRLLSLRARPAAQPMLPLARAMTLGEGATLVEALALLRASRVKRIPVLDASGRRAIGVIDGRDLLSIGLAAAGPQEQGGLSSESSVREILTPIPAVRGDRPLLAALDVLRDNRGGVVAVVDAAGELLGFLSWDHLFQALLGRPVGEVTL
jgi:CBS domain containing-hemolysin-like protein